MTTALKLSIIKRPTIKAKQLPRFPAAIKTDAFITVASANGIYTLSADYTRLDPSPLIDPSATLIAIWDENSNSWKSGSLSSLIAQAGAIDQHITAAGPVSVLPNAGTVRVDQAVGAAITINLPAAASKTCPVLVADWKGDAGTNNITIVPNGTEKIQGKSQWMIAGDTGSVFLRPIPGAGYAL